MTVRVNLSVQKSFCGYNYIQKLVERWELAQLYRYTSSFVHVEDRARSYEFLVFLLRIKNRFANKEICSKKNLRHTCVADSWRQLFHLVCQSFIFNRGASLSTQVVARTE